MGRPGIRAWVLSSLAWGIVCLSGHAVDVTISDANLEAAIRVELNQPGGPIQDTSLSSITTLNASGLSISDLSGLEFCTSLVSLNLSSNQVTDVAPLKGLLNLSSLNLNSNNICSVSRLLENPGFGTGDLLQLETNPLSTFTCNQVVPALQDRGVTVSTIGSCDVPIGPCPVVVTIPDVNLDSAIRINRGITGGPVFDTNMLAVDNLDAASKGIVDLTGLEYCANMTQVDLSSNQILDLEPLNGLVSLVGLNLSNNGLLDIGTLGTLVNLRLLQLNQNKIADISPLDSLSPIEELEIDDNQVTDLEALGDKTDLLVFSAASNQISALGPLGGAVSLQELNLADNQITDITPLEVLFNLEELDLSKNQVSNIGTVANFSSLTVLLLGSNLLSDISPLGSVDAIETLDLSNNMVSDISSLATSADLNSLDLSNNYVRDLSPLRLVTTLQSLNASNNRIRNLGPLSLSSLFELDARDNQIIDVSPLGNLPLDTVLLDNNQLCSFAPLAANPSLGSGDFISVGNNPLSSFACSLEAGSLTGRGVTVDTGTECIDGGGDPCLRITIYVRQGGTGTGTADSPYGSIQLALDDGGGLVVEGFDVTVFVEPGDYNELIEIPAGVRVVGANQSDTRIVPTMTLLSGAEDPVVVRGGDQSSIEDVSIKLPAGSPAATLVGIDGVNFEVNRLDIDGSNAANSTGVRVRNEGASDSLVRDCSIHDLKTAIDIQGAVADFGFNEIRSIGGAAAIRITGGTAPKLGDLLNLRRTGSNVFSGIVGRYILTDSLVDMRALANYWDNRRIIGAIRPGIVGAVNVALPLYTLEEGKGPGISASLFATVVDDNTDDPISNAQVSLVPVSGSLPKSGTPGVYVAAVLPLGRYTVRSTKTGYEDQVKLVDIYGGVNSVTLRMGAPPSLDFIHSADTDSDINLGLAELLRVIQLYNNTSGFSCSESTEDGYKLGSTGGFACTPHAADFEGVNPDWHISLTELLRMVQFYNVGAYYPCAESDEDGYCPGG